MTNENDGKEMVNWLEDHLASRVDVSNRIEDNSAADIRKHDEPYGENTPSIEDVSTVSNRIEDNSMFGSMNEVENETEKDIRTRLKEWDMRSGWRVPGIKYHDEPMFEAQGIPSASNPIPNARAGSRGHTQEPELDIEKLFDGIQRMIDDRLKEFAGDMLRMFPTITEVETIAQAQIPQLLRNIPAGSEPGRTLRKSMDGQSIVFEDEDATSDGSGLDQEKIEFGYTIDPDEDGTSNKVRINAGYINTNYASQTDLTLTYANSYVYVKRTIATGVCVIEAGGVEPSDGSTYTYIMLHKFTVADGIATWVYTYRVFRVEGYGLPNPSGQTDWKLATIKDNAWAVYTLHATA